MRVMTLIWLFLAADVNAEPVINENYKFYSVKVSSLSQLLLALNNSSPIRQNGEVFHGYTNSNVKWYFWWTQSNDNCRINKVTTEVDITYTLPKLENKDAEQKLISVWNKWYPALVRHEQGHAKLAIDSAKQIQRSITKLPAFASCETLSKKANGIGHSLIKRLKQLDKEYDEKTKQGETQGASLFLYL